MAKIIDGEAFKNMMIGAAAAIEEKMQEINELNVFPVPDGDTGTNMSLTLNAAAAELSKFEKPTLGKAVEIASSSLLRGARGNSGVITSLLFRGFGKRLKELTAATSTDFAAALQEGVATAYKAVMKPAEGTILTVSRVAADRAAAEAATGAGPAEVLAAAIESAHVALDETLEQNPVLKRAGVVDAGGYGWVIILENMHLALTGVQPKRKFTLMPQKEKAAETMAGADFSQFDTEEINFAYCTEFIVERADQKRSVDKFRDFLCTIGDCVVAVDDEEIIKVHVHTDTPDKALGEALKFGHLLTVKIENMVEQLNEKNRASGGMKKQVAAPERKYGFVGIAAGEGIAAVFADLGIDSLVEGGQTMNPSTEDILNAIDATPAEIVFVLPNNKNIIMSAEQAGELSEKLVVVIPTKMVTQGITAMLAFNPDVGPDENEAAMIEAAGSVATGQITYAARDSELDGKPIKQGDFMALIEGKLLFHGPRFEDVAKKMARELCDRKSSFITIFYGEGADETEVELVKGIFEHEAKNAEITVITGGQPVYSYIVSVE